MSTGLKPALELLRTTRERTISMTTGLSQAELDWQPGGGKWSIGEVLDHLLLSEKVYRDLIAELIELARSGRKPRVVRRTRELDFAPGFVPKSMLPFVEIPFTFMTLFVPKALREWMLLNATIPGQSPSVTIPTRGLRAEDLRRDLGGALERTVALLEANPGLDYAAMKAQHALLGVNNVPELLEVVALHERRHQDQIAALLSRQRGTAA